MKKRVLIVGGILIAVAVAGGLFWKYYGSSQNAAGGEVAYVSSISMITGYSSGITNRYAGVVEAQETVEVNLESGRNVSELNVETGQEVKKGQLLFEYDLSSIQEDLQQAQLDLDRLKNEALSLNEQIVTLEKEKQKASSDNKLSYTIEIETNKMNLKKNEYDQKSKEAEIQKLQNATVNTEVRSEIDGVIQKIDASKMTSGDGDVLDSSSSSSYLSSSDSSSGAFITILSTGAYRIKGTVNEQNVADIVAGEPVIIRSRVDDTLIWRGTMGTVDTESASSNDNSSAFYGMVSSSSSQTTSSTYPFYVELEVSDGLMLGQHVYIEKDEGQEDKKNGLWLSEYYIVDADTDSPYVWAVDDNKKLEKRSVVLGQYDADLAEYEIADGLTVDDCIAYPSVSLIEGMSTSTNIENTQEAVSDEMLLDMESDFGEDMEICDDSEIMEGMEMFDDEITSEDMEGYGDEIILDDENMMDDGEILDEDLYGDSMIIDDSAMFEDIEIMDESSDMDVFSDEDWIIMEE